MESFVVNFLHFYMLSQASILGHCWRQDIDMGALGLSNFHEKRIKDLILANGKPEFDAHCQLYVAIYLFRTYYYYSNTCRTAQAEHFQKLWTEF